MRNQSPLDHLAGNPAAADLLSNPSNLKNLFSSPNTQKLMDLLNKNAGGGLKGAAESAMKGDTDQLIGLMNQLLQDPEGAEIVANLKDTLPR